MYVDIPVPWSIWVSLYPAKSNIPNITPYLKLEMGSNPKKISNQKKTTKLKEIVENYGDEFHGSLESVKKSP